MIYRVTLTDGSTHDVPGDKWPDSSMTLDNTYDPENCLWFDDIVDALSEYVPGPDLDFTQVEVLKG